MEREARLRWSTAAALMLHLAVLGALWRTRPPRLPAVPPGGDGALLEVTLSADPPSPAPVAEAPDALPPGTPETPAPTRLVRVSPGRSKAPLASKADHIDGMATGDPGVPAAIANAVPRETVAPGSAASAMARTDMLPPPLVPRAARVPSGALDATLPRGGDPEPIGAGAQVVAAARALADARAPRSGHGTVTVETDADGNVTGVRSTSPSWEAFAGALQARLAGKRLRVLAGKRGVIVRLAVSADVASTPPVLTGEAKAAPCRPPERERDQVGRADVVLNVGCLNWLAFAPLPRHRVSITVASEQAL